MFFLGAGKRLDASRYVIVRNNGNTVSVGRETRASSFFLSLKAGGTLEASLAFMSFTNLLSC